jgi:hypothetical protein
MKKKSAQKVTRKATAPKIQLDTKIVALSFQFLSIVFAVLTFFLFISVIYSAVISTEVLKTNSPEFMSRIIPIFAAGFGAFVLERISKSLERLEQEGLFAAVTIITFSVIIGFYSNVLQGTMSIFAIPVFAIIGVMLVILLLKKDIFTKDGNNSLVFFSLIYAILAFVSVFPSV